jgi:hypothetical protein
VPRARAVARFLRRARRPDRRSRGSLAWVCAGCNGPKGRRSGAFAQRVNDYL